MAPRIPLLLLSTFAFSLSQYTPDWVSAYLINYMPDVCFLIRTPSLCVFDRIIH